MRTIGIDLGISAAHKALVVDERGDVITRTLRITADPVDLARLLDLAREGCEEGEPLRVVIEAAPSRDREDLENTGWVRHTLESAVWGLLTTESFEEALVQVVNLGGDSDTAGAVVGALAGATYGLEAIPVRWREAVRGEWPLRSQLYWGAEDLIRLANLLGEFAT